MKIAITDACIFIDLFELELITHFFCLRMEAHTSVDVLNEMDGGQQRALQTFIHQAKLTAHSLTGGEIIAMNAAGYPKALSNSDKTVLFLAEQMDAMLLSSDKLVRYTAKNKGITYHGLLWIIDQLKEQELITSEMAIEKLTILTGYNFYTNNAALMQEMQSRLKEWRDNE